jgi:broad specificity phosphatase PhoE
MTRFWWVRHGPTHAKGMVGWTDLPADLSDTAQIERLSGHLPQAAVLVSSDLSRAVATADAIAAGRQRLPHDPALREINFGAWEMKHHSQIETEDPDRIRAYWDQPGDVHPPGGESWNQVSARVCAAADRLVRRHAGADIIVVAHFGAILTQVQRALGIDAYTAFGHRIDNLSVTRITFADDWRAGPINHLP